MRIALVFALSISLGWSQETIVNYSSENGLPHDLTYEIFQDKDGFIWIGTDDGVAKFDGQEFTILDADDGLTSNFVIAIDQFDDGTIILGTWGGGLHFVRDDQVLPWKTEGNPGLKINDLNTLNHVVYSHYGYRNLKLSVDPGQQLYQHQFIGFQDAQWKVKQPPFLATEPLVNFSKVRDTLYGHYKAFNGLEKDRPKEEIKGVFRQWNDRVEFVFPFLNDQRITAIGEHKTAFVATTMDSIFEFNTDGILAKAPLDLGDQVPVKILPYGSDFFLILGRDQKGLKYGHLYDRLTQSVVDLRSLYRIKSTFSDMHIDHEGNLWISTYGEGVYMVSKTGIGYQQLSSELIGKSNVKGFVEKNESVYILTNDMLLAYNKGGVVASYELSGFGKQISIVDDAEIVVSSIKMETDALSTDWGTEKAGFLYQDLHGFGIVRLQDSLYVNDNSIPVSDAYSIQEVIEFGGELLIGTNKGLARVTSDLKAVEFHPEFSALKGAAVNCFQATDDELWIGTNNGLYYVSGTDEKMFTNRDGLLSSQINALHLDRQNRLWIGTQQGAAAYDGASFYNITAQTGLNSSYITAIFQDSGGRIWLGGNKGVTLVSNEQELRSGEPPRIVISESEQAFSYTVISYHRAKALVTQYKINSGPWITTTSNAHLNFSDYKRGSYTFQLRSRKEDSDWSYSQIYPFSVVPPWYLTWWFIAIALMVVGLLGWLIALRRIQHIKRKNDILLKAMREKDRLQQELSGVRETIARDFHDDMGNKLASISMLSEQLQRKADWEGGHQSTLTQIARDADYLYKGTRDFIFSLKPDSDELEEVIVYLSDFGEDLFSQFQIDFDVRSELESPLHLPYFWSRQLIFIFKEAMANTVKHAGASSVSFTALYDGAQLYMSLTDNGVGLDKQNSCGGQGIKHMRERAKKIGGILNIKMTPSGGCQVEFSGKPNKSE